MTLRSFCRIVLLGLGVVAGAVLPATASAQVPVRRDTIPGRRDTVPSRVDTAGGRRNLPPAGRDSVTIKLPPTRADTMLRTDSALKGIVPLPELPKRDTIKAPLARGEMPAALEIGPARVYDRSALFATGAVSIADLLGRVPGLTEFATGFYAAPSVVASQGDFRRIRLFIDGLELDPMDLRSRGTAPVNDMPLHAFEELRIERGAEEVRVYARTWRVDRTIPFTRADIGTGDQSINVFRGYFGRRYAHGEALQISADKGSTQPELSLPSSDVLNVMARLGITRGPWSLDGFAERSHRNRATWVGTGNQADQLQSIPEIQTDRTTAYARLGNGDPDRGRWFQAIASAHDYRASARESTNLFGSDADTTVVPDSTSFNSQYLVTGGVTKGPFAVSGASRLRVGGGRTDNVFSGRASGALGPLSASVFAESRSVLAPSRLEGTVRAAPFDRIAVVASASRTGAGEFDRFFTETRSGAVYDGGVFDVTPLDTVTDADTAEVSRYRLGARTNLRAEAGVRLRDVWITGGVIRRGATTLLAPAELGIRHESAAAVRTEGEATATTASIRGRVWRAVNAEVWGLAWNDSLGYYRPKYQTRSELYIQTNLLDRFPKGNFGLLASLSHEYRSEARFPVAGDTVVTTPGYRVLGFKLELRVQTAVVTYQFRNLLQERYAQVPGFNMPRQTQFYGIRWDFWN